MCIILVINILTMRLLIWKLENSIIEKNDIFIEIYYYKYF